MHEETSILIGTFENHNKPLWSITRLQVLVFVQFRICFDPRGSDRAGVGRDRAGVHPTRARVHGGSPPKVSRRRNEEHRQGKKDPRKQEARYKNTHFKG